MARSQLSLDPPPPLSAAQVDGLLERRFDWRSLAADGIHGLLQPGVDGDVAGLSLFQGGLEHTLSVLQSECERAQIAFHIVSESAFRETTWFLDQ